jgi:glycosyltransferase involved in cell wall biosynthesis
MNEFRVAWLLPVAWFYWQPALNEFTQLFSQTTVFTGLFPRFGKRLEGSLRLRPQVIFSGDRLVGVSKDTIADLVETLKIATDIPMRVILNLIHVDRVQRLSQEAIAHPGFQNQDIPVIVTAARLAKQKQLDGLLQAFAQVVKVMPVRLIQLSLELLTYRSFTNLQREPL